MSGLRNIYNLEKIETERLLIRPVMLGDEVEINKRIKNSLNSLQEWEPWAKNSDISVTLNFIQSGVFSWQSKFIVDYPMVLVHKDSGNIIGVSGYNNKSDLKNRIYEIGYWCDINYQGNGLITEVVNAISRYALNELKARKIIVSMQISNEKSIAVAKRLNFKNEGIKDRLKNEYIEGKENKNYIYVLSDVNSLPDLECFFYHKAEENENSLLWLREKLENKKILSSSKAIQISPWSKVFEVDVESELLYLKQTPKDLYIEVSIIELINKKFDCNIIPKILYKNKKINCFVMKKCGDLTLREYFSGRFSESITIDALTTYRRLQEDTINIIDELINLGVPDWRLDKFSLIYELLVWNENFLTTSKLTLFQQEKLQSYIENIKSMCKKISSFGVFECLNHSDFHENNILYDEDTKAITIIDLGETAICHPFFSLAAYLGAVKNRYSLSPEEYYILEQKIFDGFLKDKSDLSLLINIINKLLPIYLIFAQKRFLDAIDFPYDENNPLSVKHHNRINEGFVWFLKNMDDNNIC